MTCLARPQVLGDGVVKERNTHLAEKFGPGETPAQVPPAARRCGGGAAFRVAALDAAPAGEAEEDASLGNDDAATRAGGVRHEERAPTSASARSLSRFSTHERPPIDNPDTSETAPVAEAPPLLLLRPLALPLSPARRFPRSVGGAPV